MTFVSALVPTVSFAGEDEAECPIDGLEIAGELFVCLDAEDPSAGTEVWLNGGTAGNFNVIGEPIVEAIGDLGNAAVTFNSGGINDAYECENDAPAGLVGVNPTRTIEVWAYNPDVSAEETMVAWGRRGGPDGTEMSFNYGNHGNYGAVTHWGGGGPDIGWIDNTFTFGAPEAGSWHHLVYTFDGGATNTTKVYADGVLMNSEQLASGLINTHAAHPIMLAVQIVDAAGALDFGGRSGLLSLGRVRVHDGVLTADQVLANYVLECPDFFEVCRDVACLEEPSITGAPKSDVICATDTVYTRQLEIRGTRSPTVEVLDPPGATINGNGLLTYELPDPVPNDFEVVVEATNVACPDDVQAVEVSWVVELQGVGGGDLEMAGDLLVHLDVEDLTDGEGVGAGDPLPDVWPNRGEMDDFLKAGNPLIVTRGPDNAEAVSFNEEGRSGDSYESQEPVPVELLGPDPQRSIEVWCYNPTLNPGNGGAEETILSWGRRGGPDGTNMAFLYGNHALFGAIGHWGGNGPDIGWSDAGGNPPVDEWHHLAYTYDGMTTRVYADGELENFEDLAPGLINTHPNPKISLAQQHEGDGVSFTTGLQGALGIAIVRIHSGALSPCQVKSNYRLEHDRFIPPCPEPGSEDDGDTVCQSIEVEETGAFFGVTHRVHVTAVDATGDVILYTYTADDGAGDVRIIGPVESNPGQFILATDTEWTFSVVVDDRTDCDDASDDNECSSADPTENCTNGTDDDEDGLTDCEDPDCDGQPGCVEICDNEQDDDGDGDVDCDDEDCADDEKACPRGGFVRGDSNSSGIIDLTDGVVTLSFLFTGGDAPACMDAADTDNNGQLVISDAVITFSYLFTGGPPPQPPSPTATNYAPADCGPDDGDSLGCLTPATKCQ